MCFEIYHVRLFIVLKGVWNDPRRCGIRSKPQHKCRKLVFFFFFLGFWKSLCVHKIGSSYACKKLRVQVDSYLHIARVSFGLIFLRLIYLLIKSYIFHFNTSQANLTSNWALN